MALNVNEIDSAAAVAAKQAKQAKQNNSRPVSPLSTSRPNSPPLIVTPKENTAGLSARGAKNGEELYATQVKPPAMSAGGSRNILITPENLTVKAATIRETPSVLGYTLAAFCPANNGVFTTTVEPSATSSNSGSAKDDTDGPSRALIHSSSSSLASSNANGTLNEDDIDLSGESNAIAKSKIKAGYALSNDEEGVGGGGLDMSCLVIGMRTRVLDALAFKYDNLFFI